jgi:hypothetical protein
MRKRFGLFAVAAFAVIVFTPSMLAASSKVIVTPTNHQGWILNTVVLGNGPVTTDFNGPSDSDGGNGSFHFGPIAGANGSKLEIQPPETNRLVSAFDSLAFEYQILAPASGSDSEDQIYVNVYVDSAANGIGFFGSLALSSGFYDCRYTYIADTNNPGWNSLSFSDTTTPEPLTPRHSSCAATLSGFTDASQIRFFRLNGGDTSGNDNGLEGAFDLVAIAFSGNTTVYDFEPYVVATSKDQCKNGGWQNVKRDDGSSFKNQGDCIQYANTGK